MPQTPLGHFRRNPFMRYGYGVFANYRLAQVTRGVPNVDGTEGSSAPLTGESLLNVTHTMPAADGDPTINGRGSWPAPAAGGMSSIRPEGGLAVSYTAAVGGIGPGVYPRVEPASTPINATVDISVINGDGVTDAAAFGGTVGHSYAAGTWTPQLQITDQLGRVSTKEVATGDITVTADVAAPSFTAGPTAIEAAGLTINTSFTSDDNGTVYVVVVGGGDPAPTAGEVKAGTASGGAAAEASGSRVVVATVGGTLNGLTPTSGAGTYDVYFVLNDGTNDQAGAPTAVAGVVLAAPAFTAGPAAADAGSLTIDATFTSDTDGTVYVVVVPNGDPAPTPAEVIAGTASGGGAAEAADSTAVVATIGGTITGLAPTSGSGTYDLYFVLNDGVINQAGAPTAVTGVAVAPAFTAGPTAADAGSLTIDTTFTSDSDGDVYAVVVAAGDPAPNTAEVIAGTASGGGAAEASGTVAVLATVANGITGLTPTSGSGSYDVYFVLSDGALTQTGSPTAVAGVDVAPGYSAGPAAVDGGSLTIDTTFTSDTDGDVYVVVVPTGDPAPNVAEVEAGTASGGGAAEASGTVAVLATVANGVAGLTPTNGSGVYDVYFVLDDGTLTEVGAPTLVAGVAVAPAFTAGPTAVDGGGTTIDTTFTSDTDGTVYLVVVPNGAAAPDAAEVKAGTASGGGAAEVSGNTAVVATVANGISGLVPTSGAGTYDVYFVLTDGTVDQASAPTAVTGVAVA